MATAVLMTASLLGIVFAPSSSATVYASNAGSASGQTQVVLTPASNGDVIIPTGVHSANISFIYNIATPSGFNGNLLNFTSVMKDPSNATITNATATAAGYSIYSSGSYRTSINGVTNNLSPSGVTLSGSLTYLQVYVYLNLYSRFSTLPAGTYNFSTALTKNGSTYIPSNGEVTPNANLWLKGRSFTNPSGTITSVLHDLVVCINRSLVTSSDTLTLHVVTSGNTTVGQTRFLRPGWNGTTSLSASTSLSLSSVDLTFPLSAAATLTFDSTNPGDTLTTDLSVTRTDGTEVTIDCLPAPVTTPTVAFTTSTQLTATFNVATSDGFGQCKLFVSTDLNTLVRSTYSGPPGSGTTRTCTFNGLTQGVSYTVKAVEIFNFYYSDCQSLPCTNINREFLSPDSSASVAIVSGASSPSQSAPTLTAAEIAAAAAAAAKATAEAAAAIRAAEVSAAQTKLSTILKADKAGTIDEYKSANVNITTAASLARINAEILKLSANDRADFSKIKAIADKIEFDESFFNASARPTLSTYAKYEVVGITERILPTVNSKLLELPAALRVDVKAIQDLVKVESFIDRVANPSTRSTVSSGELVSRGLLAPTFTRKHSVINGLSRYPEGSLNTMAKIEAAIKEQIFIAEAPKRRLAEIKAQMAARKK